MTFPDQVKKALVDVLGSDSVRDDPVTLYSYRCDGLTLHTGTPMGVVFPANTQELVALVKILHRNGLTFLPRGAGTGLSGGAIAREASVVIEMARFRRIVELDPVNRSIRVGPGVVNIAISEAAVDEGLYFVPDPSSQKACSVGGNVGENSGGPHTLKYGVTVNHILELEVVLPDGELLRLGSATWETPGPDLLGPFIGSEGTFGIISEITCRLTPLPERVVTMLGVFPTVADACRAVSSIIGAGIVPAALEMIDRVVIQAVEKTIKAGFPLDAEAVLIIELEDLADGIEEVVTRIRSLCLKNRAREVRRAKSEAERALIWRARKEAIGAIGSISPNFYTQDGVIPRGRLPEVLDRIAAIGKVHGLIIANVFHAGDGNLHPLILYDARKPGDIDKTHRAGREILEVCLREGGALSGEHGIGLEKSSMIELMYNAADLDNMRSVRDVFNPEGLLNPGKIFPSPGRCSETKMVGAKSGIAI